MKGNIVIFLLFFNLVFSKGQKSEIQDGKDIFDRMYKTFEGLNSIYYEANLRDVFSEEFQEENHYKIWLKKPNFVRIEHYSKGKLYTVLICDGEYIWIYWPNGKRPMFPGETKEEYEKTASRSYKKLDAPQGRYSLFHIMGHNGMGLVTFNPSIFFGLRLSFEKYLNDVEFEGKENINGEECYIIKAIYMDGQREKTYWVSTRDFIIRKVEEIIKIKRIHKIYEDWFNIRINVDFNDSLFIWKPPQGWVEIKSTELEKSKLEPGRTAPEFEAELLDAKKFKLSDYKGKVIWLCFWRIGCPPCREEIPYLEKVYQKFKDKGLIVVGFNYTDKKEIVLEFLKKHNVTFPNIVDNSEDGKRIFFEKYQKLRGYSAVPLNYIIDRNGKIVASWYGFLKDEKFIEENLKKAGIY